MTQAEVDAVLKRTKVQLGPLNRDVVFVQTCFFRGRLVPHFVVRTARGPVAVMILPNETLKAPEHFNDSGYSGVLLPDGGHGSVAVLSRSDVNMEQEGRAVLSALHSAPQA